uniref:NADP-dependent oxidoreductase domain-containing protein n=1 Tax=Clastoptera arizonana TaxID=38151 RepID=A0A1B6D865_9HEMI
MATASRVSRPALKIALESYKGVLAALQNNSPVISSKIPLNNGTSLPIVGFGTYLIEEHKIHTVLDAALKYGYRNIDTAAMYENEKAIGIALRDLLPKYSLSRKDVFITTKLLPEDMGGNRVKSAVAKSLNNLGLTYVDLYLIHWPGAEDETTSGVKNTKLRIDSWKELIRLNDNGRGVLRAIGVSNFLAKHLTHIISKTGVPPVVNQVEFHPYYNHPDELYELCCKYNIILQAYASLGGSDNPVLIRHSVVKEVATKHQVSPAQVLLKWGLQEGFGKLKFLNS